MELHECALLQNTSILLIFASLIKIETLNTTAFFLIVWFSVKSILFYISSCLTTKCGKILCNPYVERLWKMLLVPFVTMSLITTSSTGNSKTMLLMQFIWRSLITTSSRVNPMIYVIFFMVSRLLLRFCSISFLMKEPIFYCTYHSWTQNIACLLIYLISWQTWRKS